MMTAVENGTDIYFFFVLVRMCVFSLPLIFVSNAITLLCEICIHLFCFFGLMCTFFVGVSFGFSFRPKIAYVYRGLEERLTRWINGKFSAKRVEWTSERQRKKMFAVEMSTEGTQIFHKKYMHTYIYKYVCMHGNSSGSSTNVFNMNAKWITSSCIIFHLAGFFLLSLVELYVCTQFA